MSDTFVEGGNLDDFSSDTGDSQPPIDDDSKNQDPKETEEEIGEIDKKETVSEDDKTPSVEKTPPPSKVKEEQTVPYKRFKQVNDELKSLKEKKTGSFSGSHLDLIKLGKKLEKYSDEELDFITEHAKSENPEDIEQAIEKEYVQLAIEAKRKKVANENKVPGSSSSGGTFSEKTFDEIRKMKEPEFKKYLEEQSRRLKETGI